MTITNPENWQDVAKYVVSWLSHGDIAESCRRLKIDKSYASKMLKLKTRYPNVRLLSDLKEKADKNYKELVK